MAAQLRFIDTDGITVVTTEDLGNISSPGTSANKKIFVENFGTSPASNVIVSILAVGTNDGSLYAQIAPDVSGNPGVFQTTPLNIGDIAVLGRVPVWTRVNLPTNLTSDANPRQYTLDFLGTTT